MTDNEKRAHDLVLISIQSMLQKDEIAISDVPFNYCDLFPKFLQELNRSDLKAE